MVDSLCGDHYCEGVVTRSVLERIFDEELARARRF